jgi:hypothetical protein
VADVVQDPASFAGLMERTSRDGWIALHRNDLEGAVAAFGSSAPGTESASARARAELALGALHADLARTSTVAHERLFSAWDRRGGLPAGSAAAVAALAARCVDAPWEVWAARVTPGPGAAYVGSLQAGGTLWPEPADVPPALSSDPFYQRRLVHTRTLDGDPGALLAVAAAPLVIESSEAFERRVYDPCLHATLSRAWMHRAATSLGGARPARGTEAPALLQATARWTEEPQALGALLFAPWLTAGDLREEVATVQDPGLLGATMPSLAGFAIERVPGTDDDVEAARQEVRRLDLALDAWRTELRGRADADGAALLEDLDLLGRFRQEWLVTRTRRAVADDRPRQALAYAQLARDVATPGVGPRNAPAVLAVLAEAELRNGHTREALDALQVLVEVRPEAVGLRELVGDLAVLEGIDRRGDSKEN